MVSLEKLTKGEKLMKITQLIGLGESQRRIYECLQSHGELDGKLLGAYRGHQKELELLIKYQGCSL